MRAAVAWEAGASFVVEDDVVRREPGPGEVVVRVRAAGVCQTDISLAQGAFGQTMPVVLGHEGTGEVVEVGEGVTDLATGSRVLLTWVPPCGRCYFCVRGETYICARRRRASEAEASVTDLSVRGVAVQHGMGTATFAEETVVPAVGVIAIPDDLPFALAALLGCALPTGLGAVLNSGCLQPGETVLVIGCGAVGLSAVQGAVAGGAAEVVAVDLQASRRDVALSMGATSAVSPDDLAALPRPNGVGFDLAVDAVGGSRTIRAGWDAVRRGGRVVAVGAGKPEDQVSFSALELFHDQKQLIGSFYGSCDMRFEVPRMIGLWRTGRLDLEGMSAGVVPLDDINEAVRRQTSGEAVRVVVEP